MKKVSTCINCEREVYTNDLNLCKRCHQEVGLDFLKQLEPEEPEEEQVANLEELGIEAAEETTEKAEESKEEASPEKKE